jgi:hypothetical protein
MGKQLSRYKTHPLTLIIPFVAIYGSHLTIAQLKKPIFTRLPSFCFVLGMKHLANGDNPNRPSRNSSGHTKFPGRKELLIAL